MRPEASRSISLVKICPICSHVATLVFAHVAISGAEELSTFCRIHDILHVKQHRCYATGWWGGGWGGMDVNVPCTLHQHRCYATGWWGGGWGGWDVNVPCTLHQHGPKNKENISCAVGRHAKTLPLTHCSVGTKRLIRFDHLGLIKFKTFQDVRMHEFYDFAVGPQNTSAANGDVTLFFTIKFRFSIIVTSNIRHFAPCRSKLYSVTEHSHRPTPKPMTQQSSHVAV